MVAGVSIWVVHMVQVLCADDGFGVRGVGGVCEMCLCLPRGGVGCVCVRGLALGFTNPVGTRGVWDVCLCLGCGAVGGVGSVCGWLAPGSVRVRWCYVCVCCESGFFVEMAGICVLCSADT